MRFGDGRKEKGIRCISNSTYSSDAIVRVIPVPVVDIISLLEERNSDSGSSVQCFNDGILRDGGCLDVVVVALLVRLGARRSKSDERK